MKSYDIEIMTYGTQTPNIVESDLVDTRPDADKFMHFGEFENHDAALQAHYDIAGDEHYCKTHDC